MSMRDLALLADRIITDYPTYYPLFAEQRFDFDGRAPANSRNRNPVLGLGIGADGLKTGHTQEAGYGLVGSAKQGARRIVFVITGLDSPQARAEEAERIVNWAFRQFAQRDIVKAGTRLAEADVWMGETTKVGLTVAEDLSLLVPVFGANAVSAEAIFDTPLEAPVLQGQTVGELVITLEGLPETRVPLVTDGAVAVGGFETRLRVAAQILLQKIATLRDDQDAPA
jgi:D-alanyl-D-alanine carboxypeptidase (penicillin-binding protein 5/6)